MKTAQKNYEKALAGLPGKHSDVIGYAFAVDGEMSSGEVYASSALFEKLWPKLLAAAVVEAIAESKEGPPRPAPKLASFRDMLDNHNRGKVEKTEAPDGHRLELITKKKGKDVVYESRDEKGWVHRSYLAF